MRVDTLEGTAADHETRISAAETNINRKCFPIGKKLNLCPIFYFDIDIFHSFFRFTGKHF